MDVDECDALVKRFRVTSLPATTAIVKTGTEIRIICTIGNRLNFVDDALAFLTQVIQQQSTPEKNLHMWEKISSDGVEQLQELAGLPLQTCHRYITKLSRSQLGLLQINTELAFDMCEHDSAGTAPAKSVLSRFKDDINAYADQANNIPIIRLKCVSENILTNFFSASRHCTSEDALIPSLLEVQNLKQDLFRIKNLDEQMVQDAIPLIEAAANFISFYTIDDKNYQSKIRFILHRYSGRIPFVWLEFLFGVLLSSNGETDILRLNPFISAEHLQTLMCLVMHTMLRSNRLGLTNRCIGTLIHLESLLIEVQFIIQYIFLLSFYCARNLSGYCDAIGMSRRASRRHDTEAISSERGVVQVSKHGSSLHEEKQF